MLNQMGSSPWWAVLTVWSVVNAVNLLQSAGFISRVLTGHRDVNHILGRLIIGLAVPALAALVAFLRTDAAAIHWLGPSAFLAFIVLMIGVDYIWAIEFRSPARLGILIPYLVLFFGAIVLMGLPMFRLNRTLWAITAATSALLLGSMGLAMSKGVG